MAVKLLLFRVSIGFIMCVRVAVHIVMRHLQGQWGSPVSGVVILGVPGWKVWEPLL